MALEIARAGDVLGFHSISFPNEWGGDDAGTSVCAAYHVSIQLVSPTSGEVTAELFWMLMLKFPFN